MYLPGLGATGLAAGGLFASVADMTVSTFRSGAASTASYQLESDGDIGRSNGTGSAIVDGGDWTVKPASGALYEVRATLVSGTLSSGTTGSWLALSSDRAWTRQSGGPPGSQTCVFDIEIRPAGGGANIDTARITLTAESEV